MMFRRLRSEIPALWVISDISFLHGEEIRVADIFKIADIFDIPEFDYSKYLTIPPEIWQGQGRGGLNCWFEAFLNEEKANQYQHKHKHGEPYWLWFFPSCLPGVETPKNPKAEPPAVKE